MREYKITIDGTTYSVDIGRIVDDKVDVVLDGKTYQVSVETPMRRVSKTPVIKRRHEVMNAAEVPNRTAAPGSALSGGDVLAPLPGIILKLLVKKGDKVSEGQPVAIMEAMKMENEIESPITGTVHEIATSEGDTILENAIIMNIGS
ncbi:MAG: acetyl-CoA carboxylase biotin carboxyl carrier protein subunit [Candidatus Aegiribacteria sp.]|nr:acetyl-CoA carboxylase biotin carboxyl carrier protein subunit [Candidatus Aegiribacteria sp.]